MELYEEWFWKAERDLAGAKLLYETGNMKDLSVYHAQQCAEKSLKGYLTHQNHVLEKTHDLNKLLVFCSRYELSFDRLTPQATFLNGLDVEFRYPDEDLEPTEQETETAIEHAEYILEFVKHQIV